MRWFTLLLIGCVSVQAAGAVINVPADQATIQAAINIAVNGDEIIVAPGTYVETINFLGKAITVRSTDPNDPAVILSTIIDGNGAGSVVTCASGEGAGSVLSGFVITGGSGTVINIQNIYGGGMYNLFSSPTVTNCSFSGNSVIMEVVVVGFAYGGGMYNQGGSPTVTNCSFSGNSLLAAGSAVVEALGGGMYNNNSSPTVTNCSFSGNSATTVLANFGLNARAIGGGMYNQGGSPTVTNCSFIGNSVSAASFETFGFESMQAGGMFNTIGGATITDSEFCGNTPDNVTGSFTDGGGNEFSVGCPPPIPVPPSCPADINSSGAVNVTDLLTLLGAWGVCP